MNSRYKDKLVGVHAPGNYDHTSVLVKRKSFRSGFGLTMRIWNISALS